MIRSVVSVVMVLVPIISCWYLGTKLLYHQRDRNRRLGALEHLNPVHYTEEGQGLLKKLWIAYLIALISVAMVLGVVGG